MSTLPSGNEAPQPPSKFEGSKEVAANAIPTEPASPVQEVYEDGVLIFSNDPRSLDEERARLRTVIRNRAWGLLGPTDFYVIRSYEDTLLGNLPKPLPPAVADYRQKIRELSDDLEFLVDAATSLKDLDGIDLSPLLNFNPYA
jgi:hypothetical protein